MSKKLALIFLLIFSAYPVFSTNLAGILEDIRIQIADNSPDIANRERGDDVLIRRINYIQDEIASETRCCVGRISTGTVAGQREYRYPADIVSPIRLSYFIFWSTPPAYKTLDCVGLSFLYNDSLNWENGVSGLPSEYYDRGDCFGLKPTPALLYSTTYAIQIDYYCRPVELSTSTDIPFNGNRLLVSYHKLLVTGVVAMCLSEDGETVAAAGKYTEYDRGKKQMYNDIRVREDNNGATFKPIIR